MSYTGHLKTSDMGRSSIIRDDQIDLRVLWNVFWQAKLFIIVVTFSFFLGAVFFSISIPNSYKASALLVPTSSSSSSSLVGLASQFGGLATLAGLNLSAPNSNDKTAIALQLIGTWGFLEKFISQYNLSVEVFAIRGWDKYTGRLIYDSEIYDEEKNSWIIDSNGSKEPTSWQLFESIKNRIEIIQEAKTGLITLSVTHYSPAIAKKWIDLLIVSINDHVKEQDKIEAMDSIKYLEKKIGSTSISEMSSIFYQLIEEQTKTLMLAEISREYVLKTLSAAKIPEKKIGPNRLLIIFFGGLIGIVISILVVSIRLFLVNDSKD